MAEKMSKPEVAEKKREAQLAPMEGLEFVEKPLRKPDTRVYGRLEQWTDSGYQQFVPVASGTGTKREVVGSRGRAKLVKNDGQKESSYSVYANVDAQDENFAEHLYEDVMGVLKPHLKKEVKVPNAKFILDEAGVKIWQSRENKKIVVHCEIDSTLDKMLISKEWARISYEVAKVIHQKPKRR